MRHANIPLFIPHEGCPNACVFCNQRTITGQIEKADRDITPEIENALATLRNDVTDVEIAFFGGSFTGIDRGVMTRLLDTAYGYVKSGRVASIRLSTRPDYIDRAVLDILKERGVTHIELGIQSMDQRVLDEAGRGHTVSDTENACRLIGEYGFILGGQMMIGLPGATRGSERETAKQIVSMGCKEARIYPTVVFEGTELCRMAKRGVYLPLTVEDAVDRAADAYEIFVNGGVKVLRVGLQSTEALADETKVYAGANHPALGELVEGEYYYRLLAAMIDKIRDACRKNAGSVTVYCHDGEQSKVAGQGKRNKERIMRLAAEKDYLIKSFKIIPDTALMPYEITIG